MKESMIVEPVDLWVFPKTTNDIISCCLKTCGVTNEAQYAWRVTRLLSGYVYTPLFFDISIKLMIIRWFVCIQAYEGGSKTSARIGWQVVFGKCGVWCSLHGWQVAGVGVFFCASLKDRRGRFVIFVRCDVFWCAQSTDGVRFWITKHFVGYSVWFWQLALNRQACPSICLCSVKIYIILSLNAGGAHTRTSALGTGKPRLVD